jgi:nucleoside 2-deoxyribosyltransferase
MKTLYLCGGINGLSDEECKTWRRLAKAELGTKYRILDPMSRDYRGRESENVRAIVEGDKADIDASDVLLVNAERASWGTAMEVDYAYERKKVIVAFHSRPSQASPWLQYHTHLCPSLFGALSYLKQAA